MALYGPALNQKEGAGWERTMLEALAGRRRCRLDGELDGPSGSPQVSQGRQGQMQGACKDDTSVPALQSFLLGFSVQTHSLSSRWSYRVREWEPPLVQKRAMEIAARNGSSGKGEGRLTLCIVAPAVCSACTPFRLHHCPSPMLL